MKYCSKCGKELSDDARFCAECGNPVQPNEIPIPADTKQQCKRINGVKICAKCKAHNAMDSKKCTQCGHIFGMIAAEKGGKNKIGRVTCPDCGTVYPTRKSKLFGIAAIVLGVLFPLWWLGIALIVVGILHLMGKMLFGSVKKCPVCGKTPLSIGTHRLVAWIRAQTMRLANWRDQRLLARKDTALVRFTSTLHTRLETVLKGHLLPLLTLLPLGLYITTMFASHNLAGSVLGLEDSSKQLMYIDAVLNFGSDGLNILVWLVPFFYVLTSVASFSRRGRLNGLSLLTGLVSFIGTMTVTALNHQVEYATRTAHDPLFGENIKYEYYYDLGATNALFVIGALVLMAVVCLAFLVEQERRYLKLTSEGGTNL